MSVLTERLRRLAGQPDHQPACQDCGVTTDELTQAADRIETLETQLAEAKALGWQHDQPGIVASHLAKAAPRS